MLEKILPNPWPNGSVTRDLRLFGDVEVQVTGIAGAITFKRSLDGVNFVDWPVYNKDGDPQATITADGIYTIDGSAYARWSAASGSPSVTLRAGE